MNNDIMYKGGRRHVRVDSTAVVCGEWIGAIIFYIQCARMATAADWLNVTTLQCHSKGHVVLAFYCSDVKSNVWQIELVPYGFQDGCSEFDRCHTYLFYHLLVIIFFFLEKVWFTYFFFIIIITMLSL